MDNYVTGLQRIARQYGVLVNVIKRRITKRPIVLLFFQGQVSVIDACPSAIFWGEDFCDLGEIAHYFKLNLPMGMRKSYCLHALPLPLWMPISTPIYTSRFPFLWANFSSFLIKGSDFWQQTTCASQASVWVIQGGDAVFQDARLSQGLMQGKTIVCLSELMPISTMLKANLHYWWGRSECIFPSLLERLSRCPDKLHQMARANRVYALEYLLPEKQAKYILLSLFQTGQNDVFHG